MLLVEVKEIFDEFVGGIQVYAFENLEEFRRFKKEINYPLVIEWYGENYREEYLSLTYVCRECTEENRMMAKSILEEYCEYLKTRSTRY